MKIVILGLPITASWGNEHAPTYRGLVRELDARGHDVLFLVQDDSLSGHPYASKSSTGETRYYRTVSELKQRFARRVREANVIIVSSSVPDGADVGNWVTRVATGVTIFYDVDTPVTLSKLERGDADYLTRALIPKYSLYLSFTGGPALEQFEQRFGSPMARALYDSFDPPPPQSYADASLMKWDLGYAGAYREDCQPALDKLLLEAARRMPHAKFVVAGPKYPVTIAWPRNVQHKTYLAVKDHRKFFGAQRFTLNVTRGDRIGTWHAPNLRLFEAAACGTPIISDAWPGLDRLFKPRHEILIARSTSEMVAYLNDLSETERREIGQRARERVLADHTAAQRAAQLERYVAEVLTGQLMA